MITVSRSFLLGVIGTLLIGYACSLYGQGLMVRVVSVADGDTISVFTADKGRVRIRLQGIDAPELTMPYAQISRRHLRALVFDKMITFDAEKIDRHGRTVAIVRLPDGTDVCLAQIQAGLAWHFKHYENEQTPEDRSFYAAAEAIAKAARKGLWQDLEPIPPWEFRAQRREALRR